MTVNPNAPKTGETPPPESEKSAETENTETEKGKEGEHQIPKSRFDEVNEKAKTEKKRADALQKQLDDANAAQAKLKEDEAKAKGEWQTVAEQRGTELESLKQKAQRADELEALLREQQDADIKALPAELREMIEATDDLSARGKLIASAKKVAAKMGDGSGTTKPGNTGGPKPNGTQASREEVLEKEKGRIQNAGGHLRL